MRVLLLDDHHAVRQGLRSLLLQYPDIQVIGESDGSIDVVDMVASLHPDIILLDISLGSLSGIELTRRLLHSHSESRVIILTCYDDESYLLQAAQAGAQGYLLKGASADALAEAIRAVHAGEPRLSPALANAAFQQLQTLSRASMKSDSELLEQEHRLLELIADGASVEEIARILHQSERTVKRKTQEVLEKLGAASRAQAVAEAYKRGLL